MARLGKSSDNVHERSAAFGDAQNFESELDSGRGVGGRGVYRRKRVAMRAHRAHDTIIVGRDGKIVEWQDGSWAGSCTIGCAAVHRVVVGRHAHVGARHRASERGRCKSWTWAACKRQRDQYDPEYSRHPLRMGTAVRRVNFHSPATMKSPASKGIVVRRPMPGVGRYIKLWAALDLPTMVSPINEVCAAVFALAATQS